MDHHQASLTQIKIAPNVHSQLTLTYEQEDFVAFSYQAMDGCNVYYKC